MMKVCELCKVAAARIHCEADQASLCWTCDAAVHSANFLVARHSRSLLCSVCYTATPWSACGGKMKATVCVCEQCDVGRSCGRICGGDAAEEVEVEDLTAPPSPESDSSGDESDNDVVSRKRRKCNFDWSV